MTGGFTLVGDSGQAAALSHKVKCHFKINFYTFPDQVRVTSQLFDLLSDNSSVDHPLCGECTDSLLQV